MYCNTLAILEKSISNTTNTNTILQY